MFPTLGSNSNFMQLEESTLSELPSAELEPAKLSVDCLKRLLSQDFILAA